MVSDDACEGQSRPRSQFTIVYLGDILDWNKGFGQDTLNPFSNKSRGMLHGIVICGHGHATLRQGDFLYGTLADWQGVPFFREVFTGNSLRLVRSTRIPPIPRKNVEVLQGLAPKRVPESGTPRVNLSHVFKSA